MPSDFVRRVRLAFPDRFSDSSDEEIIRTYAYDHPDLAQSDPSFKEALDSIPKEPSTETQVEAKKPSPGLGESVVRQTYASALRLPKVLSDVNERLYGAVGANELAKQSRASSDYYQGLVDEQLAKSETSGVSSVIGQTVAALPQMAPPIVAARALGLGVRGLSALSGLWGGAGELRPAEDAYTKRLLEENPGMTPEEAASKAKQLSLIPAAESALATGLITRIGGFKGSESLAKPGLSPWAPNAAARAATLAEARGIVRSRFLPTFAKGALSEAKEEALDAVAQALIQKTTYKPELTWKEALQDIIDSGLVGGILGGGIESGTTHFQKSSAKKFIEQDAERTRFEDTARAEADARDRQRAVTDSVKTQQRIRALLWQEELKGELDEELEEVGLTPSEKKNLLARRKRLGVKAAEANKIAEEELLGETPEEKEARQAKELQASQPTSSVTSDDLQKLRDALQGGAGVVHDTGRAPEGGKASRYVPAPGSTEGSDPEAHVTEEASDEPKVEDVSRPYLPDGSPYVNKDRLKSDSAEFFIGEGSAGSSTERYRKVWAEVGKANVGSYKPGAVVFVSVNGNRRDRVKFNRVEVGKALKAGATIIADTEADRLRGYNVGERELAAFLKDNNYEELIGPDGKGTGEWNLKSEVAATAEVAPAVAGTGEKIGIVNAINDEISTTHKAHLERATKIIGGERLGTTPGNLTGANPDISNIERPREAVVGGKPYSDGDKVYVVTGAGLSGISDKTRDQVLKATEAGSEILTNFSNASPDSETGTDEEADTSISRELRQLRTDLIRAGYPRDLVLGGTGAGSEANEGSFTDTHEEEYQLRALLNRVGYTEGEPGVWNRSEGVEVEPFETNEERNDRKGRLLLELGYKQVAFTDEWKLPGNQSSGQSKVINDSDPRNSRLLTRLGYVESGKPGVWRQVKLNTVESITFPSIKDRGVISNDTDVQSDARVLSRLEDNWEGDGDSLTWGDEEGSFEETDAEIYRQEGAVKPLALLKVKETKTSQSGRGAITSFKDTFLSNFSPSPITEDGITYPTVEHYFQAMKSEDVAIRKRIAALPSPHAAKTVGGYYPTARHFSLATRSRDPKEMSRIAKLSTVELDKEFDKSLLPDSLFEKDLRLIKTNAEADAWDSRKIQVMRKAIALKFAPGSDLAAKLADTGDMTLIDGNNWHDYFWGVYGGKGENHLGRILMRQRQLNAEQEASNPEAVLLNKIKRVKEDREVRLKEYHALKANNKISEAYKSKQLARMKMQGLLVRDAIASLESELVTLRETPSPAETTEVKSKLTPANPIVILPIGTSGSGKSTFIKSLPQENLVVISPDNMRVEFTGDINDKSKDKDIYIEAAKRAVAAIQQGKQVVFDTTNLTKEKRKPFIEAIKKASPNANIQYKLMPLDAELAKQRIKAQIARGENRANVSDENIDRQAGTYKQMLEDIKSEGITNYDTAQIRRDMELSLDDSDFLSMGSDAYSRARSVHSNLELKLNNIKELGDSGLLSKRQLSLVSLLEKELSGVGGGLDSVRAKLDSGKAGLGDSRYLAELLRRLQLVVDRLANSVRLSISQPSRTGLKPVPRNPARNLELQKIAESQSGGLTVQVVYWWSDPHVEGMVMPGTNVILINAAAPSMQSDERVREVTRHERGHVLLETAAGQKALKGFVGKLSSSEKQALIRAGYTQNHGESNADYEARLHDEFLARHAEAKTSRWQNIVANVKAWLSRRGLVKLSNAEVARLIMRQLDTSASWDANARGSHSAAVQALTTSNNLSPIVRLASLHSRDLAKRASALSPTGGLGSKIKTALDFGSAVVPSVARKTDALERNISSALLQEYGVESINDLPIDTIRKITAEFLRPRAGRLVGPNGRPAIATANAIAEARASLNELTARYASSAKKFISDELYNKIVRNKSYLTRSYAVFTDPEWVSNVRTALAKGTHPELTEAYKTLSDKIKKQTPSATDVNIENEIFGRLSDYSKESSSSGAAAAIDGLYGKVHEKTEVTKSWRVLMGEVTDPINVFGISMETVASKVAYYDTMDAVKNAALEAGLISKPNTPGQRPGHTYSFNTGGGAVDSLSEYSSDSTFHDLITELRGAAKDKTEWMEAILAITRVSKVAQTAGSGGYVSQQIVGNILGLIQMGHFTSVLNLPDAVVSELLSRINEGSLDIRDRIDRFIELDVMDDNALNPLVSERVMDAAHGVGLTRQLQGFAKHRMTAEKLIKVLGSVDNAGKFLAMECEIAAIKDGYKDAPDWDRPNTKKIEEIAAARIKDRMPSFSRVPLVLKNIGAIPVFGDFTSFAFLTGYTLFKNIQYAYKDIKNPYMKSQGLKSLAGIVATGLMASGGMASILEAMLGGVDDEEKNAFLDAKRASGKSSEYVVYKTKDGEIRGFSIHRLDPLSNYARAASSIIKGVKGEDDLYDSVLASMKHILSPILQTGSVLRTTYDIWGGEDMSGRRIYDEDASASEKLNKSIIYFSKQAFVPASFRNFWDKMRPAASPEGQQKALTATWNMLVVGELTATSPRQLNPPEALKAHLYDAGRAYRDASSEYSKFLKDMSPHSQEEADAAYEEFDSKRKTAFLRASMKVNRIVKVGNLTAEDLGDAMKLTSTSGRFVREMITGQYRPHVISLEMQERLNWMRDARGVSNPLPRKAILESGSQGQLRPPQAPRSGPPRR